MLASSVSHLPSASGPHMAESSVVASVANTVIVFRSGGVGAAARKKPHPRDVVNAVDEARAWFEEKAVLVVVPQKTLSAGQLGGTALTYCQDS